MRILLHFNDSEEPSSDGGALVTNDGHLLLACLLAGDKYLNFSINIDNKMSLVGLAVTALAASIHRERPVELWLRTIGGEEKLLSLKILSQLPFWYGGEQVFLGSQIIARIIN